jgi:UDP-glucose 4-epimerase
MRSVHQSKILITGASGYLGGRIFQTIEKSGKHNCLLASRNLETLLDKIFQEKELRIFNISEPKTFSNALRGIDASMNHQECEKNPHEARIVNVDMVELLIHEAIQQRVKQFIYLSTFHVYGPNQNGIITEETKTNPQSIYAKTHLEAEKLVLNNKEINGKVIRLSNALGAPLRKDIAAWSLVANDLCKQAIFQKKMILNSTGHQKRDFIAANCVGDAIEVLLSSPDSNIYNLGSESTKSILEIAYMIQHSCEKLFGFKTIIETKNDPTVTPESFPDFTYNCHALRSLGFSLKTNIRKLE